MNYPFKTLFLLFLFLLFMIVTRRFQIFGTAVLFLSCFAAQLYTAITFNFRFQWLGNAQHPPIVRYQEVRLGEAREQVIKHWRAFSDVIYLRHLLNSTSEDQLVSYDLYWGC